MSATTVPPYYYSDLQTLYYGKYSNGHYEIPGGLYRDLCNRGYVEVNGLPTSDLTDAIHPIFKRRFFKGLTAAEWRVMRPTLILASRYITEKAYMGFWTHICTGTRIRRGDVDRGHYVVEEGNFMMEDEALEKTKQALLNSSNKLKFFFKNRSWSDFQGHITSGQTFFNAHEVKCARNTDLTAQTYCDYDDYPRCNWKREGRCATCRADHYDVLPRDRLSTIPQERRRTNAPVSNNMTRAGIIRALQRHNARREGRHSQRKQKHKLTDRQLSHMHVGLHYDAISQVRGMLHGSAWKNCEKIRFQLSLALVLCHELAHVFWRWTHRTCYECDAREPWFSNHGTEWEGGPELGFNWELSAFGCRFSDGIRVATENRGSRPTSVAVSSTFHL